MVKAIKLKNVEVESASEIVVEALKLPKGCWFRGSAKYPESLRPSLYRHPTAKTNEDREKLERELIDWFKERSVPHVGNQPRNDWEALFLMQHYGFPTRLLDFSESPLAAAYFAVVDGIKNKTDAVIWVLDPVAWNEAALGRKTASMTPTINSTDLKGHLPVTSDTSTGRVEQAYPAAMRGIHNSSRIVVQQGVFVIFGNLSEPMEKMYLDKRFPAGCLFTLTVPALKAEGVLEELQRLGYSDAFMFPGLDTLARLAKAQLGF